MSKEVRVYLTFGVLVFLLVLSILVLIIRAYRAQLYFEHKHESEPVVTTGSQ